MSLSCCLREALIPTRARKSTMTIRRLCALRNRETGDSWSCFSLMGPKSVGKTVGAKTQHHLHAQRDTMRCTTCSWNTNPRRITLNLRILFGRGEHEGSPIDKPNGRGRRSLPRPGSFRPSHRPALDQEQRCQQSAGPAIRAPSRLLAFPRMASAWQPVVWTVLSDYGTLPNCCNA
jgi:hypothetical protein